MDHKTFELIEVKADGQKGEFSALASVFGNVDLVGDRMLKGAFSKTLEKWRESGDPIPVVLSHQWDDPMAYVGKADPRAVIETDEGLLVQGQLDTTTDIGKQVYKLMKDRMLKGWSFGYTVPKGGQKRKNGANEISEVELFEVGPTLKGANPEAQLQGIKSALPAELSPDEALLECERRGWIARKGDAWVIETKTSTQEEPPTEKVEDPENEDRKTSSVGQDPLKDEIERVELALSLGELP